MIIRSKAHPGGTVSEQGWRLLVDLAQKVMEQPPKAINAEVGGHDESWGYDTLDDFLVGLKPSASSIWLHFDKDERVYVAQDHRFHWAIHALSKSKAIAFDREANQIVMAHWNPGHEGPPREAVVFIGHGRSSDWRELKDHLTDKHNVRVIAYETGARVGHTIRDILQDMLKHSNLAVLVHTPEDELADGTFNSRPNVIHETGLFQGRLGFSKTVVLLKDGTAEFSNLAGIQQLRYTDIRNTFGEVLAWINREALA